MNLLQLSSFLFISVTFHAYYLQNYIYHHISILITTLSILNHQTNANILIKSIDKVIAQTSYLLLNIKDIIIIIDRQPLIIILPIIIPIIYYCEFIYPKYSNYIHFSLHILSNITFHLYLYYTRNDIKFIT